MFTAALSNFSLEYASAFAAAGSTIDEMWVSTSGMAVGVANETERVSRVLVRPPNTDYASKSLETNISICHHKDTPYSMTYIDYSNLLQNPNLNSIAMINKAGYLVNLTGDSIKSAMNDFNTSTSYIINLSGGSGYYACVEGLFSQTYLQLPGAGSWPLTHFEFLATLLDPGQIDNCGSVQDTLSFMAWVQLNPAVSSI